MPTDPGKSTSLATNPRASQAGVISLQDFSEVRSMFGDWQGRMEQVSSGRFEGSLQVFGGQLVRLIRIAANQRVTFRGYDSSRVFMAFPVTEKNGESLWYGQRFPPGHLVFQGEEQEAEHHSARRSDYQGAFVLGDVLAKAARSLVSDSVSLPKNWGAIAPPPEVFAELNRRYSQLLSRGIAEDSLLSTPEGYRLEQECVRAIVAAIIPASAGPSTPSLASRSQLFCRAEEFMRAHLGAPVGAIDICRELRVSDRNLRRIFHERVGVGPMVYFKYLRLNAVRRRLTTSPYLAIADVAKEFGFHHAGNFAADYRRLFGERPSETFTQQETLDNTTSDLLTKSLFGKRG